jgi:prevent-host-death family protein
MTKTISKTQFMQHALAYLREVEESGEPLVITHHGRPVVRVAPYSPAAATLEHLHGCMVSYELPTEPVAVTDWEALA